MRYRDRQEKNATPRCPFCNGILDVPENIKTETGDFMGGRCGCGAVYACDPTGHNVGQTYLDALIYACGDDWDKFNSLDCDKDYREAVFNYDVRSHKLMEIEDIRRNFSGKIVFIKLEGK
jgi:hypothetical protein